jgi:hypothetical protein
MGLARGLGRSFGGGHLRRLFADLPGIKDEFERIGILVLLHQLEVDEAPGIGHGKAVIELVTGGFQQRGGKFVFAVCNQPFRRRLLRREITVSHIAARKRNPIC